MHTDTLHGIDKILGNIEREIAELTDNDSQQVCAANFDTIDNISELIATIVSNTPFVQMLQGMPSTSRNTEIPIITRRYEEDQLQSKPELMSRPPIMVLCDGGFVFITQRKRSPYSE